MWCVVTCDTDCRFEGMKAHYHEGTLPNQAIASDGIAASDVGDHAAYMRNHPTSNETSA